MFAFDLLSFDASGLLEYLLSRYAFSSVPSPPMALLVEEAQIGEDSDFSPPEG
jgi:hypothetical protein